MIRMAIAACLLLSGCSLIPAIRPVVASVEPVCAPPPEVKGLILDCDEAVAAAVATLSTDHVTIKSIAFDYGPCFGPDPNAAYDCAIQVFGTVTIGFVGSTASPVKVQVQRNSQGVIVRP